MATAESAPTDRAARPFQFTLRQLFWLMAIVCVLGGAYSWLGMLFIGGLLAFVWFAAIGWSVYLVTTRRVVEGVVIAILVVFLLILLLPAVQSPRGPSRRMTCQNNLKNIYLALMPYESAKGKLPPPFIADENGKPMHSWRVLILPYLERDDLYQRYDFSEPWNGPNNRKLHSEIMKIYSCPCCRGTQPVTETNYVVVVGAETMWTPGKRTSLGAVSNADGTANTLMLVEVHGSGIHWMEPRDLDFSTMPMTINPKKGLGISSLHPNGSSRGLGANVVFADGHTKWLDNDTPPAVVEAILTRNGREPIPDF